MPFIRVPAKERFRRGKDSSKLGSASTRNIERVIVLDVTNSSRVDDEHPICLTLTKVEICVDGQNGSDSFFLFHLIQFADDLCEWRFTTTG
jgi:hypothetical protein